jgi:protein ImuB
MKRVMCLWFPNWPIQRRLAARPSDSRALVLHSTSRGKARVVACCRAARKRGARHEMLLAEAQSLWPASVEQGACFEEHDPLADCQALRELALWCGQFTPTVAIDAAEPPDCLLLDATGCDYWFGGEEGLAEKALSALKRRGYWAAAVVADNIGTAWAVAHGGMNRPARAAGTIETRIQVVPPGGQAEALRPLPVESLRLPGDVVRVLHELNIFRVDQLLALPRQELPSRFGAELLLWIDRALGTIPEMPTPERSTEPLEACWEFEPPIADGRALTEVIEHLLERLLSSISDFGSDIASKANFGCRVSEVEIESKSEIRDPKSEMEGIQRLLCSLKLANRDSICFRVELLRPSASRHRLMELVRLQVERLRLSTEVTSVTVRAALVAPLDFQQEELFGGSEGLNWRKEIGELLERLSSRLGERAVVCPQLWPDVQPEHACRYESWLERSASTLPKGKRDSSLLGERAPLPVSRRPAILKQRPPAIAVISIVPGGSPKQFRWNERQYMVERCWGPERIETGWWRGPDVRRDYYLVETAAGERFWMFRDLVEDSWHLHGVFA